jgi:hypothetical protein
MDANQVKELLKPIDLLILELKGALEYYNEDEESPNLRAENQVLLDRAEKASDQIADIVLKIALGET